ncbi:type VI secretion system tube protein TssD [Xanthovirga aplysinae]|uniref:type VI secretion system tube protein TssD n=1 Tax=Xanthovirga aplysinae TaxID=2529853 RepID=UPI0012BB7F3B|nr:type VI secretion system tube protein TssD [Xanthovirga aplysinae]MTI30420.1 hypothetical protein [Xanthovirga aplysinae]
MAFRGKLFIDELELNLLEYDLEFQQPLGFQSRPNDSVKGGIFNVVFEKREQANYLMNWMTQADMRKNGHISFSGQENEGVLYKQEFWDAYCINYKETFWHDSTEPMVVRLSFAAGIIRNNKGTTFKQSWHITDIGALGAEEEPVNEEENSGSITGLHLIDLNEEPVVELKVGEKVKLIVESQGMTGETTNIELTDETFDFKYLGKVLKGQIADYQVKSERDELELEVVAKEG